MAKITKACKGVSYPKPSSVSRRLKSGGSFPDLNKDGKVTKKDVLIGRGVLPKKAQFGKLVGKAIRQGAKKAFGKEAIGTPFENITKRQFGNDVRRAVRMEKRYKEIDDFIAKKKAETAAERASKNTSRQKTGGKTTASMMKKGGKMTKKCAYGCK